MRVLILSIFILLQACNPNRGQDVATTGQAVGKGFGALAYLIHELDEVVSGFEYDGEMD